LQGSDVVTDRIAQEGTAIQSHGSSDSQVRQRHPSIVSSKDGYGRQVAPLVKDRRANRGKEKGVFFFIAWQHGSTRSGMLKHRLSNNHLHHWTRDAAEAR
jgi:hypothetical protein